MAVTSSLAQRCNPTATYTMPKAKTKPKASVPQRQIETRAKNKTTHPGLAAASGDTPPKRTKRSKLEVQEEKEAKARAKAVLAEARNQSINRAAEFEHADIANEETVDNTPRPVFTPKPRPISHNHRNSPLTSPDTTDIGESDNPDETPFMPGSEDLIDGNADVESDGPSLPAKEKKAKSTRKATVGVKNPGNKTDRKRRVVDVEGDNTDNRDVPLDTDEEQPREPKPKKVKTKVRDEINVAAMKIVENEEEGKLNRYAKMVSSMQSSGKPASKVPVGGKPLKREGAIADIKTFQVGGKKLNKEGAIADIFYPDKSTIPDSGDNNIR